MRKIIWEKWIEPHMEVESEEEESEGRAYPVQNIEGVGYISVGRISSRQSSRMNIWLGHCNFYITKELAVELDKISGVEVLTVLSPYRFRIAIGKGFTTVKVKAIIEKKLNCNNNLKVSKDILLSLKKHKLELDHNGDPYLLYVLPNGSYETRQPKTNEELKILLTKYEKVKKELGGKLIWKLKS